MSMCVCVCALLGANKNAVAKLNILFSDRVRFCDLSETPVVGQTSFTAFTIALSLDRRHYVGVGKTKKAARNAAAERALVAAGLWTHEDESVKAAATMEVDEDPVVAVYRMQDVIAHRREMQSMEQGGWRQMQHAQPRMNFGGRGGPARGRGRWIEAGPGWGGAASWGDDTWSGPFQRDLGEWSNHGPGNRGWHQSARGSSDLRRGRPGVPRGRGFRDGGNTSEAFHRNIDTSNTNSRGLWGKDSWNRAGQDRPTQASSGRGDSGRMRNEKPFYPLKTSQSSSGFHSTATSSSPTVPLSQFSSSSIAPPVSMSAAAHWNFVVDPATGIYRSSTNQNQPGLPSASQASANYVPTTIDFYGGVHNQQMMSSMSFAGNSASRFMQPSSHGQNAAQPVTLPSYGAYSGTGFESFYGQTDYSLY